MCIYDCTVAGGIGGRFSAEDVENYIKVPPYKRTDKTYSPNITDTIQKANNIETSFKIHANANNQPIYAYQVEQGTTLVYKDDSTKDNVIYQPQLTMTATAWLPNEKFLNDKFEGNMNGYPLFLPDKPYEIIWTYKDNTQTPS